MLDNERRVKIAAIEKGLKMYQVAAKVGVSPPSFSNYLLGKRTPPPGFAKQLARVLGLPPDALKF